MQYLHWEIRAGGRTVVRVDLDAQANVMLLDENNYAAYRRGHSFNYRGGLAKRTPFTLVPPYAGLWHLVIDLGGYSGQVNASVSIL